MACMEQAELFQRIGIAVAIGFAVGVERGWKSRAAEDESRVAGLRTYILIGVLGGVGAILSQELVSWAFAALTLVFGAAWTAFKWLETQRDGDISITGLVAGLIVYALGGYAIVGDLQVAAAAGVFVVMVLAFKETMHDWLRALSWNEIRSALLILAATFIALPLLPSEPLDPFGAFNPRALWLITVVLASASFAGYVALRVFGPKAGLYLGAGAGALASSTAVTIDLARRTKAGELDAVAAGAAAAIANCLMFARVGVLLAIIAPSAFLASSAPLAAATLASLLGAGVLGIAAERGRGAGESSAKMENPLDLVAVGRLALLLAGITVIARLLSHFYGDSSVTAFAAIAGLADVDAVTLAVGGLAQSGSAPEMAAHAVLAATAANSVSKMTLAALGGQARFALVYAAATIGALAAGLAALLLAGQLS